MAVVRWNAGGVYFGSNDTPQRRFAFKVSTRLWTVDDENRGAFSTEEAWTAYRLNEADDVRVKGRPVWLG